MSCSCECDEYLESYKQLTSYTAASKRLPQSQWVVEHPAVVMHTVPALTEFVAAANLFHSSIWNQVKKNGVLKVTIISGTVVLLTIPMGPTGAVDFGDNAEEKFILETHEVMVASWASPDGAVVRVEAFSKAV